MPRGTCIPRRFQSCVDCPFKSVSVIDVWVCGLCASKWALPCSACFFTPSVARSAKQRCNVAGVVHQLALCTSCSTCRSNPKSACELNSNQHAQEHAQHIKMSCPVHGVAPRRVLMYTARFHAVYTARLQAPSVIEAGRPLFIHAANLAACPGFIRARRAMSASAAASSASR